MLASTETRFHFLLLLLLPAQSFAMAITPAEGTCPPDSHMCLDGTQCYVSIMQCDGVKDCNDGTDENDCAVECKEDQFKCKNGNCIDIELCCNGANDCGDSSDEEECSQLDNESTPEAMGDAPVAETTTNVAPLHCPDGSDEGHHCQKQENTPEAIGNAPVAETATNVAPLTTVANITATSSQCGKHEFQCNDGTCLDIHFKCDLKVHCPDGSDEGHHCQKQEQTDCKDSFLCHNGMCIPSEWYCDGNNDCQDGSDEENCEPKDSSDPEMYDECYNIVLKKESELRMKRETDIDPLMKLKLEIAKQECYNQRHLYELKVKELTTRNEVAQTELQAAEYWKTAMKERLEQQRDEHRLSVASLHAAQLKPSLSTDNNQTVLVKKASSAEVPTIEIE